MNSRRISCSLCAAASGLLGAAFLPAAVAFADTYAIVPDPSSGANVTSLYGEIPSSPAVTGIQGTQEFDVIDKTTGGNTVGTFEGIEEYSRSSAVLGGTNQDILVTSDLTGTDGTAAGDTPPPDSVINLYTLDGIESIYSDEPSNTGDVISDQEIIGNGHITTSNTFDAAAGLADHTADQHDLLLPNGDTIVPEVVSASDPAGSTTETFTGITGLTPFDVAIQGTQVFDVENADGEVVGTFTGDVTTTSDVLDNYTEAILVTSDDTGTAGTSAGDVPAVGSVFNAFYSTLVPGEYNMYSAIPTSDGDQVTDALVTSSTGKQSDLNFFDTDYSATHLESEFDAHTPLSADGYTFDPVGTEQFVGVNGLPPLDAITQGYQQFDVNGTTVDADVATQTDTKGEFSEAILITNDGTGTVGTGAGDVPPVGSEFNIVYHPGGMETIYSDIPGAGKNGADLLKETLVFQNGHEINLPTHVDPSFGLSGDTFSDPFNSSDLLSSTDAASALTAVDPSGGLDAGAVTDSLLQSHDIWLDALHALAGLF